MQKRENNATASCLYLISEFRALLIDDEADERASEREREIECERDKEAFIVAILVAKINKIHIIMLVQMVSPLFFLVTN